MVWYSHLFQNFPQFIVIHTVKGFGIVNKRSRLRSAHFGVLSSAERSYPASEVRGGSQEELPQAPTPKARGGGWEDQPHVQGAVAARAQEGLEELSHIEGQEGRR